MASLIVNLRAVKDNSKEREREREYPHFYPTDNFYFIANQTPRKTQGDGLVKLFTRS
jgi:hypothetical protein